MKLQQGDVLLNRVKSIPKGATKVKPGNRGYVVAEGEMTGHAHCFEAVAGTEMFKDSEGNLYMSLLSPQKIKHEEHKHIEVPAGKYKIGIVKEVDPFADEIHKVRD